MAVTDRKAETTIENLDTIWLHRHGCPESMSEDDEFNLQPIRQALTGIIIILKARPARRHNKVGSVERKNGTIRRTLERLTASKPKEAPQYILAKSLFLSNSSSGSRTLSSFQPARGYSPSIVGNPSKMISHEIIEAHKNQTANLALNILFRSRNQHALEPSAIKE